MSPTLTVRVERRGDASADTGQAAGQTLATLIKNTVGIAVRVDVVEPAGVERSTGKMRRILDQRQNG